MCFFSTTNVPVGMVAVVGAATSQSLALPRSPPRRPRRAACPRLRGPAARRGAPRRSLTQGSGEALTQLPERQTSSEFESLTVISPPCVTVSLTASVAPPPAQCHSRARRRGAVARVCRELITAIYRA